MKRFLIACLIIACLIIASVTWANAFNYENPIPAGAYVVPGQDVGFGNITAISLKVGAGTEGAPSIVLEDSDDGFYKPTSASIGVSIGGVKKLIIDAFGIAGVAVGATARMTTNQAATAIVPIFTKANDANTGMGSSGLDQLSLIAGSIEALRNYTTYSEFYPSGAGQVSIDDTGSIAIDGGVAFSGISTVTADYMIGNFGDDPTFFIECAAALGNISTTLPPVADKKGRLLEIKLLSAANGCYIDGNEAETIDGSLGQAITTQYNSISLIAGSSEWLIY